jgi:hypothetical protein
MNPEEDEKTAEKDKDPILDHLNHSLFLWIVFLIRAGVTSLRGYHLMQAPAATRNEICHGRFHTTPLQGVDPAEGGRYLKSDGVGFQEETFPWVGNMDSYATC